MAIGPGFMRLPFRLIPGKASQQLPFPEMVQMPRLSPPVQPRPLPTRQAEPLAPDPRDVLRRPRIDTPEDKLLEQLTSEPVNLYARPRKIHDAPYSVIDPVTGQEIRPTWNLKGPRPIQTQMLIEAADEGSVNEVFALVLNTMRQAETPDELYPVLVQLNALRKRYGAVDSSGSSGRIIKGSAGEEGGTAGVRALGYSGASRESQISSVIESAIDNEVWRAAYRVGIPESQLGKWADAFSALDIKGLGGRAEKTPLMALAKKVSNIRSRKNDNPQAIAKSLSDLEEIIAPNGPMVRAGLPPEDIDYLVKQVLYTQERLGIGETGLKLVSKHIGTGLPEDQLHAIIVSAMKGATSNDEIFAISSLAKGEIKSITFLDDIEDEALQAVGRLIRARNPDDISSIGQVVPRETSNERFARRFEELGLRRPPGPEVIKGDRIFGTFQNQGLFENLGSTNFTRFGPSNNFRSWEVYDPNFNRPVHVVQRWNKDSKKWEEVARNPVRPSQKFAGTSEYNWIGDPESGTAIKAPRVEYQNFFYRIAQPSEAALDPLPPLERLRDALAQQRISYGLKGDAQKISNEVVEMVAKMVSDGDLVPGTSKYNWMHTVFGRIALNIYGPGVRVGETSALVSRDANAGRRIAAMKALEHAISVDLVPAEAAVYLRTLAPADDAYEAALQAARAARPKPKPKARATKTAADPELTAEQELAILRRLLESERAKSSRPA